jgi:PKD repeat protein
LGEAVRQISPGVWDEGIIKTYSSPGNRTAFMESCCRISTLRNNPDGNFRTETVVNVGTGNANVVSSLPPIMDVPDNQIATFQIPGVDPNGDAIRYRLATSAEAVGFSGYVYPPGLTISQSGLVTWNILDGVVSTLPGHLWTVQVMLEDLDGSGNVKSKSPLDFIIRIGQPATVNAPPTISANPAGPFQPVAGQTLTFDVTASDTNGTITALQALNPPTGMTFNSFGSPASTKTITATWTPTAQQANQTFVVTFQATDNQGATATTSVTISPVAANQAPTANAGGPYTVNEGGSISLNGAVSGDADGSIVSYEWDLDYDGVNFTVDATGVSPTFNAANLDGPLTRSVALRVTDDDGAINQASTTVAVQNVAPTAEGGSDVTINEGATLNLTGTFTDPAPADTHAFHWHVFLNGQNIIDEHTQNLAFTPADDGVYTFLFDVVDDDSGMGSDVFTVTVDNVAPTASASNSGPINEGQQAMITVAATDPAGASDPLTYEYDSNNDGIYEVSSQSNTHSFVFANSGPNVVNVRVTDGDGGVALASTTVTVKNVVPTVGAITAPVAPVAVGTPISASATFTDPGVNDTHTAKWDWGDGTPPSDGTVDQVNDTVTGSHTYAAAGVYTVKLTVTDDGGSVTTTFQYVVVYDASAGFVTGGGWIDSPAGALAAAPTLTGRANFGFVSKYQKGATTPTGQTQFQFTVGNLNFHSTSYDWLVVAGARAQYKGTGTINGSGNYKFLLTAIDGQLPGGGGDDKFRIKIWDETNGIVTVVYDNQMGLADDGNPTTLLGGGSIKIHS